ncbi:MAG: hypothetical protein HY951_06395 [Bacteroidia bacterium]|nr:hypothetical protein [Bacteroidia bacterium]
MQRNYSKIYSKIVENDDDFVGVVAYALYKQNKIQFIENFKKDNNRHPTDTELAGFHQSCYPAIKQYKAHATQKVQQYGTELTERQVTKIQQDYATALEGLLQGSVSSEEVVEIIRKNKSSFWRGVMQSLIASFLIMLITIIILFFYASNKITPLEDSLNKYTNTIKDSVVVQPKLIVL